MLKIPILSGIELRTAVILLMRHTGRHIISAQLLELLAVMEVMICCFRFTESTAPVTAVFASTELPRPEQWLGNIVTSTTGANVETTSPSPRRAPLLSQHLRAHSLGSAETFMVHRSSPLQQVNGVQQQSLWPSAHNANGQVSGVHDPFDAEWAAIAARNHRQAANSTNPFITPNTVKTFEVHM